MRRVLHLTLILSILLACSGCWDLVEVDRRAFITALGIDIDSRQQVMLTVQTPLPHEMSPPGSRSGTRNKDFYTISASSKTIYEAFRDLQSMTERRLVIQQKKILVIGEAAARFGVEPLLNWLVRSPKNPPRCPVFVARQRTAREVLTFTPETKTMLGLTAGVASQTKTKNDRSYNIPGWLFHQKLLYDTKDVYAPLIDIDQAQGQYIKEGLAVFDEDRMVGALTAEETQAFGLLANLMQAGGMTFDMASGIPRLKYSLQNVKGKTKIKVLIRNGEPHFLVNTKLQGSLIELIGAKNRLTPDFIAAVETQIQRVLASRLRATIKKLQQLNSDPINFEEEFRVQQPEVWRKIKWKTIFPTVGFTVKVKVKVVRNGILR